jgi:hypothetical protein
MATPPSATSNPATVVVAAAEPEIQLAANPTELPASGGTVALTFTTNLPDGSSFELYLNGQDTGQSTTSSSGAGTFTYTAPANATLSPVDDVFTVQSPAPTPAPAPAPSP